MRRWPEVGVPIWLKALVIFTLLTTCLLIVLYLYTFRGGLALEQDKWGQFGDFVGGILNPLVALTALFALLYTIVLQSRELRDSAEQLRKSAEALATQNSLLDRQAFEGTFFQLIALFNEVVKGLRVEIRESSNFMTVSSVVENKQCLEQLHKILRDEFIHRVDRGDYVESREAALRIEYRNFYEKYGHLVGHYFRTLYRVIKFVDDSQVDTDRKRAYISLVRAQLTKHELGLLLYNCVSDLGREKFRPLVVGYDVLKHLEDAVLAQPEDRHLVVE